MRTAIFWGLMAVAGAINPAYAPLPDSIFIIVSVMFLLMNLGELAKK